METLSICGKGRSYLYVYSANNTELRQHPISCELRGLEHVIRKENMYPRETYFHEKNNREIRCEGVKKKIRLKTLPCGIHAST